MHKKILPALLAGVLLIPASAALAAANASATIEWGGLDVKPIAFDPLAELPVFKWTDGSGLSFADAATNYPWLPRIDDLHFAPDLSTPLSSVATTAHAQGSGLRGVDTLMAQASSEGSLYLADAQNDASGQAWNLGSFSLTGAGIALITLPYSISVSSDGICRGLLCDSSSAEVSIELEYISADGVTTAKSAKLLKNNDPAFSGTFSLAVINLSASVETTGTLLAQVRSTALSPVTAVPEPENYAMLLAGLGIVGLGVRRRSQ